MKLSCINTFSSPSPSLFIYLLKHDKLIRERPRRRERKLIPCTIKSLILSVLVLLKLGGKLERRFVKSFHIHKNGV